jgi:simple sugar transport system ATP-binding protein
MIYQDLALARMQDVATNIFLGREPTRRFLGTPIRMIDRARTGRETDVMIRKLGARVPSVTHIVGKLSGGSSSQWLSLAPSPSTRNR